MQCAPNFFSPTEVPYSKEDFEFQPTQPVWKKYIKKNLVGKIF
jgi:hypothetical protein